VVTRALAVVAVLALATPAHADSPKLEQARKAIDEVRFDDAQRLLVGALADGGNSPSGVREIYKLSASTAVVLGQREVGEQYFRRWLALDAAAALGTDVAPKLREPFEAAQAYIAAHGRLNATATWLSTTELDVAVSEPFAMATSVSIAGGTPVALSTEHRARLPSATSRPVTVVVFDDHANHLIELQTAPPDRLGGELVPGRAPAREDPGPPPAATPARTTDATFLSTSSDAWAVIVDRRPACTTPCSLQLAARQYVGLRNEDQDVLVDVGYLPAGSVVVKGTPKRKGRRALGTLFTVVSAAAIVTGISLTAVGCSQELGGLCLAGLITGPAGGLGLYGSIQLLVSGRPGASVTRGAPEVAASFVGRF